MTEYDDWFVGAGIIVRDIDNSCVDLICLECPYQEKCHNTVDSDGYAVRCSELAFHQARVIDQDMTHEYFIMCDKLIGKPSFDEHENQIIMDELKDKFMQGFLSKLSEATI